MRLFAAIFPPADVLDKLTEAANTVKQIHTSAILVKPEKMHMTLEFFDDAPIEEVEATVERAIAKYPESFDIMLNHIDAFPRRKNARVIFAGARDQWSVVRLMQALENESPHAHLTLARLPVPRTTKLMSIEPITFRADRIALVNSTLGPNGRYEILREWKLE